MAHVHDIEQRARKSDGDLEVRADNNQPSLSGYAAVYNAETEIAGLFREQIAPGAFSSALDGTDDVRALFNHDPNVILGRTTSGTLHLSTDKRGLRYSVDLNMEDPDAVRVHAKVKRGDVNGSSFGFRVLEEKWQEPKNRNELALRTITRAELFDVSPVVFPAYPQATVSARSKDKVEELTKALAERDAQAEAAKTPDVKARESARAAVSQARAWGTA